MARPLGDARKILTGRGGTPVGLQHQGGHVLWRVAREVAPVLDPWHGVLDEGLAGPVHFPGHRQARAPKVAVQEIGRRPNAVKGGEQNDVPPARAVSAETRVFGHRLVPFRSRRAGHGPGLSLAPLPLALALPAGLLGLAATARAGRHS